MINLSNFFTDHILQLHPGGLEGKIRQVDHAVTDSAATPVTSAASSSTEWRVRTIIYKCGFKRDCMQLKWAVAEILKT
jgi:hypothetical protein